MIICFITYFPISIGKDLSITSDIACKLIPYAVRICVQIPSWIQVFITYDRYFLVAYPNRFRFLRTKLFIFLLNSGMMVFLLAINVPNLLFNLRSQTVSSSSNINGSNMTSVTTTRTCVSTRDISLWRDMTAIVVRTMVPFFLILYGNSLLVRTFLESKRRVHASHADQTSATNNSSESTSKSIKTNASTSRASKKEFPFINSIIAMDVFFLISLLPLAVTLVISNIYTYIPSIGSPGNVAANRLAYFISIYFSVTANIFTFVVTLMFNKLFKRELLSILTRIRSKLF